MNARRRSHRSAPAFTLPEVLASLLLMGIALPAIMQGLSLSMTTSDDARKRVEAASLAETKLAELTATATGLGGGMGSSSGDFGADWPAYRWEATSNSIDTDLDEIRVRVWWLAQGRQRSVNLSSFVYVGSGAAGDVQSLIGGSGGAP